MDSGSPPELRLIACQQIAGEAPGNARMVKWKNELLRFFCKIEKRSEQKKEGKKRREIKLELL